MGNLALGPERGRRYHGRVTEPVVHLKVDGDDVRFAVASKIIHAGSLRKVRDALKHEPPRAEELEAAIDIIEEFIMPVVRELPAGGQLVSSSEAMLDVVRAIGGSAREIRHSRASGNPVSVEEVEALFNRLADVATGMPAETLGVPVSRSFATHLLLLREVMHHGGFAGMRVV